MARSDYDVIVVGGGMVGLTFSLILARDSDCKVAIVEKTDLSLDQMPLTPSFDARSTALAQGTVQLYQDLGVWPALVDYVEPINDIHISQQGHFGATRLNATEQNELYLGVVIENRFLGRVLLDAALKRNNIDIISSAQIRDAVAGSDDQRAKLTINQNDTKKKLEAELLIAADGANSALRRMMCLDAVEHDYDQMALIANVKPSQPHQGIAYERFSRSGPMAMLPLTDNRFALVWSLSRDQAQYLLNATDQEFLSCLQDSFGFRAGKLVCTGKRSVFPLRLISAQQQVSHRFVLLGNAAHSLHPVAGQGFNLCARDCIELGNTLLSARHAKQDIGHIDLLNTYQQSRAGDQQQVIQFSDKLVKLFSTDQPLVKLGRTAGLLSMEFMGTPKTLFAQRAMGQTARLQAGARYG